ncbi:hypothetical protein TTHERM_000716039 (macronuclear) [Tetrahymena thermophila SB210]|uniref:Uncharacterized protein n=1 Tax=Tetrahymena thermophila (strain SB210) TaxID=312017 RepID=W7X670_TETTS|nr:hypothetical protein TTHERM_000716039 [Tetrahymena thermophila SB210]EWS71818.1 hypothetical protein TTHERM_000716039 [Tetrahymena thermophila SB210]|eukprot:XP_012655640.1 hypothetical protein TTHERM_000716039 [Tetrahymena thermophila SB210]
MPFKKSIQKKQLSLFFCLYYLKTIKSEINKKKKEKRKVNSKKSKRKQFVIKYLFRDFHAKGNREREQALLLCIQTFVNIAEQNIYLFISLHHSVD